MAPLAALLVSALAAVALGTRGVDLSTSTSQNAFSCLKSKGYTFAVVRCYESVGHPDAAWYLALSVCVRLSRLTLPTRMTDLHIVCNEE
jgi:hypothetical protein